MRKASVWINSGWCPLQLTLFRGVSFLSALLHLLHCDWAVRLVASVARQREAVYIRIVSFLPSHWRLLPGSVPSLSRKDAFRRFSEFSPLHSFFASLPGQEFTKSKTLPTRLAGYVLLRKYSVSEVVYLFTRQGRKPVNWLTKGRTTGVSFSDKGRIFVMLLFRILDPLVDANVWEKHAVSICRAEALDAETQKNSIIILTAVKTSNLAACLFFITTKQALRRGVHWVLTAVSPFRDIQKDGPRAGVAQSV